MSQVRSAAPFVLLAALAAIAACASSATCPSGSTQIATYTVTYEALDEGDTCIVSRLPDGGATYSNLVSTPASSSMLLCATGADGGTPQLFLSSLSLAPDGGATYFASGTQTGVTGSACICELDIGDSVSVTFATPDGGPFSFVDGGPVAVPTFSGRIDYSFGQTAGDTTACGCNVPCGAHYTLAATQP